MILASPALTKDIHFGDIPLLAGLDRVNLAKLIPVFEEVHASF